MLTGTISKLKTNLHRPLRAKLIFNPGSGQPGDSPQQLVRILTEMQKQHILPEVYLTEPDSQLERVVEHAIKSGIKLIVVAGGDGTIDSILGAMIGNNAILGIIPTGTRNNVAFNLGVTGDIADSVALLRHGRRLKIDVGRVHFGHARHWFLEGVALGLISDLYPMADGIQHGDLSQISGLLSTLVSATPSSLTINLDGKEHLTTNAHMLLVSNMPFIGPHFQISPHVSFKDSHLDVFTFSDMSKLNMISFAMLSHTGPLEEAGIKHFRARHLSIVSEPQMPVLADGSLISPVSATGHPENQAGITSIHVGAGTSTSIHVHPRAMTVMAGKELTGQRPAPLVVVEAVLAPDEF